MLTQNVNSVFHFYAREYARRGLAVFPLQVRSKVPATKSGFKDATTDLEQFDAWWGSEALKYCNIGIATGLVSKIAVLDIDAKPDAAEILTDLEAEFGKQSDTACNLTGGHGMQFFFSIDRQLPSRIGIRLGVDLKADGGYVVVPPSVHPNGRKYHWDGTRSYG